MAAPVVLEAIAAIERRVRCRWTPRDAVLYALGVGAGAEQPWLSRLSQEPAVLPTFAATLSARALFDALMRRTGSPALLHREQAIRIWEELPATGEVEGRIRSSDPQPQGRGATIEITGDWRSTTTGSRAFETVAVLYVPGARGTGTRRAPAKRPPSRVADLCVSCPTYPNQALVYRLSGDRNPLHSDPLVAREAGFDAPILHGLCTYGMAGLGILRGLGIHDPSRLRAMSARFSRPVSPGECLDLRIWEEDAGCSFEMRNGEGQVVLDCGDAELAAGSGSARAHP